MKTITVPDIGYYPIELKINNNKYTLQPGKSMSVPDEVAALLDQIVAAKPKTDPDIAKKQPATVAEVEALIAAAIAEAAANTTILTVDDVNALIAAALEEADETEPSGGEE